MRHVPSSNRDARTQPLLSSVFWRLLLYTARTIRLYEYYGYNTRNTQRERRNTAICMLQNEDETYKPTATRNGASTSTRDS